MHYRILSTLFLVYVFLLDTYFVNAQKGIHLSLESGWHIHTNEPYSSDEGTVFLIKPIRNPYTLFSIDMELKDSDFAFWSTGLGISSSVYQLTEYDNSIVEHKSRFLNIPLGVKILFPLYEWTSEKGGILDIFMLSELSLFSEILISGSYQTERYKLAPLHIYFPINWGFYIHKGSFFYGVKAQWTWSIAKQFKSPEKELSQRLNRMSWGLSLIYQFRSAE